MYPRVSARTRREHDGAAAEALHVVEEGSAVVVREDLERDTERLAVAEDRPVVVGNTGRPEIRVQVVPVVEAHPLPAVEFLDHVAAAGRQIAATGAGGGLQNRAAVARLRQFVSGNRRSDKVRNP